MKVSNTVGLFVIVILIIIIKIFSLYVLLRFQNHRLSHSDVVQFLPR
jgi:hypothetical protein